MLHKTVHMASLLLKWRGLCRHTLQGDTLAAGQVHCWPLMVGARLTRPGTVLRTRWNDAPPLCLSLQQLASNSWTVYLSSPNQWQGKGGKTNLEKNFGLTQNLCRDQFEQSLDHSGRKGLELSTKSILENGIEGPAFCSDLSWPQWIHSQWTSAVLQHWEDPSVQSSIRKFSDDSIAATATTTGSGTPAQIPTRKLQSTTTDN